MKNTLQLAVLALGLATVSAQAAETYSGLNFSAVEYKEDGIEAAKPTAISFKLGAELNRNFAVEARLGAGMSSDFVKYRGVDVDVEVDSFYGIYGKLRLPVTEAFTPYALVGYTHGEITARFRGFSYSESDSDASFGIGADFNLNKNTAINLEWARLFEGEGYEVKAISIGFSHKF